MTDVVGPRVRAVTRTVSRDPQRGGRLVTTLVVVAGLVILVGPVLLFQGLSHRLRGGAVATVLSGTTLEISDGPGWIPLAPGAELTDGASVRTGADQARLRLRDGEVWLGPGAAARLHSHRVDLVRGETVVRSGGLLGARWTDVDVAGAGTFRLTPGTNPRIGVYHGEAEVRRPAESRALRALEQLGLAGRRLPADPDPLDYRSHDPWDAELLGQAIAFDDEVDRIARGIDLRFTRAPRPLDFYRGFTAVDETTVPVLQGAARETLPDGQFGPPSDVLVTLFVATAAARGDDTPLPDLASLVVARRADGARWGLVAIERDLTAQEFSQVVNLSQIDTVAAPATPLPAPPPVPSPLELFTPLVPAGPGRDARTPGGADVPRSGGGDGSVSTPEPLPRTSPSPALPPAPPDDGPVADPPVPELTGDEPPAGGGQGAVRGTVDALLDTAGGVLGRLGG